MSTPEQRRAALLSIFLACLAYFSFNIGDAALKAMGGKFHFSQIIFISGAFGIVVLTLHGALTEGKARFATQTWPTLLARVALLHCTTVCNIYSLTNLPLTTFYTLIFTSPFIVAGLSAVFLKEPLGLRRLAVIAAGFCVVLFVFRPGGGLLNIYVPLTVFSAFCYSMQLVITRHAMRKYPQESVTFLLIVSSALALVWTAPFLPKYYIAPSPYEWLLFVASVGMGTLGYIGISYAFKKAPAAAVVAPCHYTQIAWAAVIGWIFFSEVPAPPVVIGACVLIALGLYLIWSETRLKPAAPSA